LANGIEIDERTFRCAEGVALLHRSDTLVVSLHIYRTTAVPGVMVFAKTLAESPRTSDAGSLDSREVSV
jgi:hypothetical protein